MVAGVSLFASSCAKGDVVGGVTAKRRAPVDSTTSVDPANPSETLRIGVVGVDSLDPAHANPASASSMLVADLLFDGLTGYDATKGTVVGALASSWGVSADGLTWKFELDTDARFSDGSPITAGDVKASLERVAVLGDSTLSGIRFAAVVGDDAFVKKTAQDISGIVAAGQTVEVHLRAPYSPLPELLADPTFGVVKQSDVQADGFAATPIGSGPFAVTARIGNTWSLRRVHRAGGPGRSAALAGIAMTSFADDGAAYAAFAQGELDESPIPKEHLGDAANGGQQVVSAAGQVSYLYGMNVAAPALANVQLRRAILRAVDRDGLRRQLFPEAVTMAGLIGPGVSGRRDNACGAACAYDPQVAAAAVKAAFPEGGVPTVHVDFFAEDSGREAKVAATIAANLVAAGIPAEPRSHTLAEFQHLVVTGGAELFRYGWVGSYPSADAYLSPFETSGADNVFSLADPELTAALAKARSESADPARVSAYLAAEDRMFSLAPVLPLVQFQTHVVATAKVRGLVLGPDGSFDVLRLAVAE